jgi:hypothetical protein
LPAKATGKVESSGYRGDEDDRASLFALVQNLFEALCFRICVRDRRKVREQLEYRLALVLELPPRWCWLRRSRHQGSEFELKIITGSKHVSGREA